MIGCVLIQKHMACVLGVYKKLKDQCEAAYNTWIWFLTEGGGRCL